MPKAMFAATPPRRISSPSTRNDRETRSSLSAMRCSVNFPGNVIRWSVATDPVTAIRTNQWNESPQAQEPLALGLSIVKPCFSIVSTKSMVAPIR